MIMSLFKKLFDYDQKELKRFEKLANEIESLDEEYKNLSDEELKNKTIEFRKRLEGGHRHCNPFGTVEPFCGNTLCIGVRHPRTTRTRTHKH